MSPHKMFRREFIEEHGLRFPEGPWILEDLLFVSAAYLKAERISILADYPCYYWMKRDDAQDGRCHRGQQLLRVAARRGLNGRPPP